MADRYMERAKAVMRRLIRHESDPVKKEDMKDVVDDLNMSIWVTEQRILDAKMIGVRNPSFDGDEVGYPDDDFDNEDKDNFRKYGRP